MLKPKNSKTISETNKSDDLFGIIFKMQPLLYDKRWVVHGYMHYA